VIVEGRMGRGTGWSDKAMHPLISLWGEREVVFGGNESDNL